MDETPIPTEKPGKEYWQDIKDLGLATFMTVTGDPEAMKTLVDILANGTIKGLQQLPLKDEDKAAIKENIEKAVDKGADGIMETLTWYQKKAVESNGRLRGKFGRNHFHPQDKV